MQDLIKVYEKFPVIGQLKCSEDFRLIWEKTNSCALFSCILPELTQKSSLKLSSLSQNIVIYIEINIA